MLSEDTMELINELQRKITQTELIIDAAHSFASSLRLDEVMPRILARVLDVIEAADAGILFLYDKVTGKLKPMASSGFVWETVQNMILSPGESMTGVTFEKKTPHIYRTREDVQAIMKSLTPLNEKIHQASLLVSRNSSKPTLTVYSTMCAPLLIMGECIGVMTIDSLTEKSFTMSDLNLLVTLSNLAAVALENARLYEEEKHQKARLERLNHIIQAQNVELIRINQAHQGLMNQLLSGSSITEIGTAARILDNPVIIYNDLLSVLAKHLPSSFDFDVEDGRLVSALQETMRNWSFRRVDLPTNGASARTSMVIFPIVASHEVLGVLTVFETSHRLTEQDIVLAEQCSIIVALELQKRKAVYEAEQRIKREFLDDLISEKNIGILQERAKSLGIMSDQNHIFFVVDVELISAGNTPVPFETTLRHIQKDVETIILNQNPSSLIINRLNTLAAIVAWPKKQSPDVVLSKSKALAGVIIESIRKASPNANCSIGIGRVCKSLDVFLKSYQDATRCVTLIKSKKSANMVEDYTQMGAVRFILEQPKQNLLDFVEELLRPLVEHSSSKRIELIKALDAFILSGKNYKEAAAFLDIHPNTLAYRLKCIEQILGCRLDEKSASFNLDFAWQVLETFDLKREFFNLHE